MRLLMESYEMDDHDELEEGELLSRQYQTELEEIAIKKNTIIYLPTGSGKTHIAIRLIKRFRKSLEGEWGHGAKRTFFLVNTVPLVKQQQEMISKSGPVKGVSGYSGEDRVDYWNKQKWDKELSQCQVVVMTSQILCDMLTHNYIQVSDINLLIFDECHHAIEDHPMRAVMKHFETCPPEDQPRVLGLTATLLHANVNILRVEDNLRNLERTFHATIATVNELGEVLSYSTHPNEVVVTYQPATINSGAKEAIDLLMELERLVRIVKLPVVRRQDSLKLRPGQVDISTDPMKIVKHIKNMISSMVEFISELGIYGGNISVLAYIILLEQLKRRSLIPEEELLYKFTITYLVEVRMVLMNAMRHEEGFEKITKHSSDKIIQLLNILKEYNPSVVHSAADMKVNFNRNLLSGILFVKKRFTAKILYNLLKDVTEVNPQDFGFLKHDYIVGFNINPFNNTREQYFTKKKSQQILLKFCNKDVNCLISTSIIEEGIDVPQCLLVLRFDEPFEYRSYVQSKGRARNPTSSYVIMIDQAKHAKFLGKYREFQKIEGHIQNILVGKSHTRNAPTSQEIKNSLYDDDEIPPYETEHGNRLAAVSAVSLLNRYCSCLPHDQYTMIAPMWIKESCGPDKTGISILLPLACPIKKPIMGAPMYDLKNAKRSAALTACIKLHKAGELDPITILPKPYGKVNYENIDIKQCFLNWPWDSEEDNGDSSSAQCGTKRRIRKHARVYPKALDGPDNWKEGSQVFFLHVIVFKPAFAKPKDTREQALYDLLNGEQTFGFLTSNPLPKLCDFPMFLSVGEVSTSIKLNYAVINLTVDLFECIKQFHFFVFDQLLEVAKKFVVFDNSTYSLFVVPISSNNGYDIDWDIIAGDNDIPPVTVPKLETRKNLNVTKESYLNKVISPWYRATILPDRYIVTKVMEYMSPTSHFETNSFDTYADYYSRKYNLEIEGSKDQPLLEVRNFGTRINCLMPRGATYKSLSEKQRRLISAAQGEEKSKKYEEIFIAEFCTKYEFPAILWYKATILPSALHRIFMLLVAEELRLEIAAATKYGKPILDKEEEWLPIKVELQIALKSMLSQLEYYESDGSLKNTIDRINNPIDEAGRKPLKLLSMKDSVYQLQKQKINKEYPWEERMEPIDIERNLSTVTVMEIECYDEFITAPISNVTAEVVVGSSLQRPVHTSAAILPPPMVYNDKIRLLDRSPEGRGPELREVLSALTTTKSNDTHDLERAETLGDAFLKYAASLYLYHKFPTMNEGQLTNIKCRLIGNRNLFYAGEKKRLGGRMKVDTFSIKCDCDVPAFFAPKSVSEFIDSNQLRPSFLLGVQFSLEEALSGKLSSESLSKIQKQYKDIDGAAEREPKWEVQNSMQSYVKAQAVPDKTVSDCVEAIIGTYLNSGGIGAGVKILEWFKIIPAEDNLETMLKKKVSTAVSENKVSIAEIDYLMYHVRPDIEEILNYKFKDPALLLEALSHPSYIRNRHTPSYERLEFIGDAVLDFLVTSHIFETCGDFKPGDMTDLRSALVNNVTFAAYVVKLGLHKYLCSQLNPLLDDAIMAFVEHQEQRDHEIVEDVLYLIDEEECQIAQYVEVPKTLSDIFESIAGAVYLDSGGCLKTVWKIVYKIMHKEINNFSKRIPIQPVRVLFESIYACPHFGEPNVTNTDVPKMIIPVSFTKEGRRHTVYGVGANKNQAKRAASKLALKVLGC